MALELIDWIIIIAYLLFALGIGVIFSNRASGGMADFFLAGRSLPWWLAGTSIVATTFAADTPLMVSGFIRTGGIYENWIWWSAALGAMVSVIFYARLWRRSHVLTDLEFIELRYSGKAASALRLFLAGYSGVLSNCIVMGWVMLAMAKLGSEALGVPEVVSFTVAGSTFDISGKLLLLVVLTGVVLCYTTTSGMWGVVCTDFLQFAIAMIGAIALMVIVYIELGGPTGLVQSVAEAPGVQPGILDFVPTFQNAGGLAMFTFFVYISIQWWASTAGASPQNQRVLSTRDEKQATYASIWGTVAHYVIRPWPWVIVGLASVVYFPITAGEDPELAYPRMMMHLLPVGLKGLMVVAFLAAFMSTIDTRINWGASYVVNDVYGRFVKDDASDRHYLWVSRIATAGLLLLGGAAAFWMDSIVWAWMYLIKIGAGAGLVVLLRWFWWRINAWSEIAALSTSFVLANALSFVPALSGSEMFGVQIVILVVASTVVWVTVTLLTRPTDPQTLATFYRRVRPGGWWGPVARRCPEVAPDRVARGWPAWVAGVVAIYASLFGLGYLCIGQYLVGILMLAIAGISSWFLMRGVNAIIADEPVTPAAVTPPAPAAPKAPAAVHRPEPAP